MQGKPKVNRGSVGSVMVNDNQVKIGESSIAKGLQPAKLKIKKSQRRINLQRDASNVHIKQSLLVDPATEIGFL